DKTIARCHYVRVSHSASVTRSLWSVVGYRAGETQLSKERHQLVADAVQSFKGVSFGLHRVMSRLRIAVTYAKIYLAGDYLRFRIRRRTQQCWVLSRKGVNYSPKRPPLLGPGSTASRIAFLKRIEITVLFAMSCVS